MSNGNLGGVIPGVDGVKKVFIPAAAFGGVAANTWRPLSTSSYIHTWIPLFDLYPGSDVEVYVHWTTSSTTTTDTCTWIVNYRSTTADTDAATADFTALDTAISADAAGSTANAVMRTGAGRIDPRNLQADELHAFQVGVSATSGLTLGDTDNVNFVGLELRYSQGKLM